MIGGIAATLVAALVVYLSGSDAGWIAAPFAMLWLLSPAIALWISRSPRVASHLSMSDSDALALRLVARRTWRFFETFVTAEDHMLPPDNFQEDPSPVLAHRTSPTNLGLYLLSTVSARDFGWIGTIEAVERLEATLDNHGPPAALSRPLLQLVRHPRSAPAGAALRFVRGQRQSRRAPHYRGQRGPGVDRRSGDAGRLRCRRPGRVAPRTRRRCRRFRLTCARSPSCGEQLEEAARRISPPLCGDIGTAGGDIATRLQDMAPHAATLVDIARTLASESGDDAYGDLLFWSDAIHRSIESWRRDVTQTPDAARALKERLVDGGGDHEGDGGGDGVRLPARPATQAAFHRLPCRRRHARPELLRSARVRGAPGELRRDRQGRRPQPPLVSPRPAGHACRQRRGAHLLVGLDVRIPDALSRDARTGRAACWSRRAA